MSANWKTVRIFISSTFRDMHAERDHLINVVFPELQERMAVRRLHLRAMDLRWGVLQEENALDICLSVIEECRPFFIGLLGGRYGYIPPPPRQIPTDQFQLLLRSSKLSREEIGQLQRCYGHSLSEEAFDLKEGAALDILDAILEKAGFWGAGQSITAREILRGVLDEPGQQMISFFYLRDPRATTSIPAPDWDTFNEQDPLIRRKLDALKQQIKAAGLPVRTYEGQWDPDQHKLTGLEDFGRQVLEDLWKAIDAQYPPGQEEESSGDPEREAMDAFAENRVLHFVGRRGLLDRLFAFAEKTKASDGTDSGVVCVSGPAGCGKSALLSKFCLEFPERIPSGLVLPHFVGATPASANVYQMLVYFWSRLSSITAEKEEQARDLPGLVRQFPVLLEKAAQVKPLCLVIDAVNQLEEQDVSWLPEQVPPGVTIVLSALEGEALQSLRKRQQPPLEWPMDLLEEGEVREIIGNYLSHHLRKLSPDQMAALLSKSSTRNPLYLLVALEELRLAGRFETLEQQIKAFPDDIPALFESMLLRVEQEFGFELVRDFLAFIATGRGGLAEADLRALLKPPDEPRLPDLKWARLVRALQFYLLQRAEAFDFYHQQLRQAVENRYVTGDARKRYHQRVARYLSERGLEYPATIDSLPFHLSEGGLSEDLYRLVEDPHFRELKVAAKGSVHDLCADIARALDAALAQDNLSRIAQFGFMHADYHEGRFGKINLFALYDRSLKAALPEVRLLREGPRFRALVWLALKEAEAGRPSSADDLLLEALAIRGLVLAEGEAVFLGEAAARLMNAGCRQAPGLLRKLFRPPLAIRKALEILPRLSTSHRGLLLAEAIHWLLEYFKDSGYDTQPVDLYESAVQAVFQLEDEERRISLIRRLEEMIVVAGSVAQKEPSAPDMILSDMILSAAAFMMQSLEGEAEALLPEDVRLRMQAILGQAMVAQGEEQAGLGWLEKALDSCGREATLPGNFGFMARLLGRLPWEKAEPLFRRLIVRARTKQEAACLRSLLDGMENCPAGTASTELFPVIVARAKSLPAKDRLELLKKVALLLAKADRSAQASMQYGYLFFPAGMIPLLVRNPLMDAATRFSLAVDALELPILSRSRDASWLSARQQHIARLIPLFEKDQTRLKQLKRLIRLGLHADNLSGILEGIAAVGTIPDQKNRADALVLILREVQVFLQEQRQALRDAVLETVHRIQEERFRLPVWVKWLETIQADDSAGMRLVQDDITRISDPTLRAAGLASLAGALAVQGDWAVAEKAWVQAMTADQEASTGSSVFAARLSALANADAERYGQHLSEAFHCPDPELAFRAVDVVAREINDPARLAWLETEVRNIPWPWYQKDNRFMMYLAVARAWARVGDRAHGAQFAREGFDWYGWSKPTEEAFQAIMQTDPWLAGDSQWLRLMLKLVSVVARYLNTDPDLLAKLVDAFSRVPDEQLAREALSQTYLALFEVDDLFQWRNVAAMAELASGLARQGQMQAAQRLLEATLKFLPNDKDLGDESMWAPAAPASAHLAFASAWHDISLASGDSEGRYQARNHIHTAIEVADTVQDVMFRAESVKTLVQAGTLAQTLELPERIALQEKSEICARALAEESHLGSRWVGLEKLVQSKMAFAEVEEALALLKEVQDNTERETLLLDLIRELPLESASHLPRIWHELATPVNRNKAAWAIAGKSCQPEMAVKYPVYRSQSWRLPDPGVISSMVLALVLALSPYWLIFQFGWPWLKAGFSETHNLWWLIPLLLGLLFVLGRVSRTDFYLVPILPVILLPELSKTLKQLRRKWRHWVWRMRFQRSAEKRFTHPAPRLIGLDAPSFKKLLRIASVESGPFDLLLSAWMTSSVAGQTTQDVVSKLPAIRLPQSVPEVLLESQRQYDAWNREDTALAKLRRKAGRILSKTGLLVSGGLVLAPMVLLEGYRRERRIRKAHQLAQRGDQLLNQNKTAQALPLLKRAVRLYPENPFFRNDYAVALQRLNQIEEAIAEHRLAIESAYGDPNEAQLWYALGYTLWSAGRDEEGLHAFEKVLELGKPGAEEYEEAKRGRQYCLDNMKWRKGVGNRE